MFWKIPFKCTLAPWRFSFFNSLLETLSSVKQGRNFLFFERSFLGNGKADVFFSTYPVNLVHPVKERHENEFAYIRAVSASSAVNFLVAAEPRWELYYTYELPRVVELDPSSVRRVESSTFGGLRVYDPNFSPASPSGFLNLNPNNSGFSPITAAETIWKT